MIGGRYRIIEPIGAGGMGRVYRAQQLGQVERNVAVKLLYSSMEQNVLALKRFENEARVVGQLRHPNTVRLVDAGRTDDGRLYLITELLLGTRLDRVLADRRPNVRDVIRILIQICGSLSEAHLNKIVHRDLKPSNVFIERVGRDEIVKVLDFGIAKLLDEPAITRPMTIVGTPGFMSPEQGAGRPLDGRSDLYALGAIAFECLAGRPPHVAEGKVALLVMQLSEPAPDLSAFVDAAEVPKDLCALVMRMLEHDPAKRPASADEVRDELERIAQRLSTRGAGAGGSSSPLLDGQAQHETTTELGMPVPMARPAMSRGLIVLLVIIPLVVLGLAVWFYLR